MQKRGAYLRDTTVILLSLVPKGQEVKHSLKVHNNDRFALTFCSLIAEHKVTLFQVDQWNAEGLCSNTRALIDVLNQMKEIK